MANLPMNPAKAAGPAVGQGRDGITVVVNRDRALRARELSDSDEDGRRDPRDLLSRIEGRPARAR